MNSHYFWEYDLKYQQLHMEEERHSYNLKMDQSMKMQCN